MDKKLLIIGAIGLGAAYLISKENAKKPTGPLANLSKVKFDEELLEKQGFIFACNNGTWVFVVKDPQKLKDYSEYVVTNLLMLDQFKDVQNINFKDFFSDFITVFSEECSEVYESQKFDKSQAIAFYESMRMAALFLLSKIYGEFAAKKIIENPDLEIQSPDDAILYQQAVEYYTKNIELYLLEWKLTFGISEEDIEAESKKHNFLVY